MFNTWSCKWELGSRTASLMDHLGSFDDEEALLIARELMLDVGARRIIPTNAILSPELVGLLVSDPNLEVGIFIEGIQIGEGGLTYQLVGEA